MNAKAPEASAEPRDLYVIDTTATEASGPRVHDMLVDGVLRPIKFMPAKPNRLPWTIAVKFLKSDAFRLCDKDGNLLPWRGAPKQPEDYQAGERFKLDPDQTVANYEELHTDALRLRVSMLPKGETMIDADRGAIIEFIMASLAERRAANTVNELGPDDFVPEPELEDAL